MDKKQYLEEKIGEGLIRIGAMTALQVEEVLKNQRNGDNRLFGEIAVELGFVDIQAVINYLKSINKQE